MLDRCLTNSAGGTQVDASKQDLARLQNDNAQLHAQLVAAAEKQAKLQQEHYQNVKKMEDQVAQLSFWKQTAAQRYSELEGESDRLKARVAELLRAQEGRPSGADRRFWWELRPSVCSVSARTDARPCALFPRHAPEARC